MLEPEVRLKTARFPDRYREIFIRVGSELGLRARAYNEAVAFRWELRSRNSQAVVNGETCSLNVSGPGVHGWIPHVAGSKTDPYFSHQESMYVKKPLASKPSGPFPVPVLFEIKEDLCLLVTDVNVEHYPGLWMRGEGGRFVEAFPAYPRQVQLQGSRSLEVTGREEFIAKVPGNFDFPWRAMLVTGGKGLLESSVLYSLADSNRIGDTSWIKPGKVTWDWWNHFALEGVAFKPGVNQESYLHYIDFASENGFPYLLLDEGWSDGKPENLLKVKDTLDIPALSAYARSKNVALLLWMTSVSLDKNFDAAFEAFEKWKIAGIKVDFMQRDDQVMNEFCSRVAAEAAKRKLLVDFHGGSKPTGMHRTYPNVLSCESVRGMEQALWNTRANPDMAVMNAFIRMSVGPMDYTPGAMINMTQEGFQPGKASSYKVTGSMSTRCQQLALFVVYTSPLQMLCDSPSRYRKNPAALEFLRQVPTVWDQSIALHAKPCEALAVARRNGDAWYIGCLTDSQARELELDLGFLPQGGHFEIQSWADGPDADRDAQDCQVSTARVDHQTKLKVRMAKGGGFAAILKPSLR